MPRKCRVLDLPPNSAVFNTALDMYLIQRAAEGDFTLAFTKWLPSVSVGSSQSLALDVNLASCEKLGVGVIRRLSGGQAVYLDENYLVFTAAGPRNCFPADIDKLREELCQAVLRSLRKFNVPAVFVRPDNLVVEQPRIRTLGNSGQAIKKDALALGASVRYDLPETSLRDMLSCLKTNGRSLSIFFEEVKKSLAWILEFSDISIDSLKTALIDEIEKTYDRKSYEDALAPDEIKEIYRLSEKLLDERLADKPHYISRGVCYFNLKGECIVPEIANFWRPVKPSTHLDSIIS